MSTLDPVELAVWRNDRMGKTTLFESEALLLGLNSFEPGQSHAPHLHEGQDKVYLVLQGRGRFRLGEQVHELGPGQVLVAPAGTTHGVENLSDERLLLLVTMAPPPQAKT